MTHPKNLEHSSSDLVLALNAQGFVSEYDDLDPELLGGAIEEEEEEEEDDLDLDSLSDDELNALSPEELAKLRGDHHQADGEQDEDDLEDDDPGADPGADKAKDDVTDDEAAEIASGKKQGAVPYSRFKEVNDEARTSRERLLQLEEENARLKGQVPAKEDKPKDEPKAYDFDAAEDRYMDAVLDGDKDKAKTIRAEIRAEERRANEAEAKKLAATSTAEERERVRQELEAERTAEVLDGIYEKYPFLDHAAKGANKEAIQEVVDLRDVYVSRGMPFSKAIAQAAERVGKLYAPEKKADDDGRKKDEPSPADRRAQDQRQRNATAELDQPSRMNGSGQRSRLGELDIEKMSDADFDKLTKEELAELRGDNVRRRNA